MKLDLENTGKYWVDEQQIIPKNELKEFASMYRTEYMERLKGTARGFFNKGSDEENSKAQVFKTPATIAFIVLFVITFVGILIHKISIAALGFATMFFFGGVSCFFGKGVKNRRSADDLVTKIWGVCLILASVLPVLSWFIFMKDYPIANRVVFTMGMIFASMSLGLIVTTFLSLSEKSRAYNEQINAQITGFARYIEYDGENHTPHYFISPVFEYSYEGEHYVCVYDEFRSGHDSEEGLGSTVINISPKYPECIYNPKKMTFGTKLILSIAFALFSAAMVWLPFTPFLEGSKVNIDGKEVISTSESGRIVITDDDINTSETDWFIKEGKIKEIYTDDVGEVLVFEDSAFCKTRPDQDGKYETGHSYYLVYTVDGELLVGDQSQGYKHVMMLIDAEEYEYKGSHLQK